MFIVGLFVAAVVSSASFFLIIFLTTPQGGSFVIALFFFTFFLSLTSTAALLGMLFDYLVGWRKRPVLVDGLQDRSARTSNSFRRGILLGGFGTLLLLLQSWGMLTLGVAIIAFIPFALLETYIIGNSL
ncbi:MAG: hypothetical protein HYV65_01275 [Candidatus Spechtbacteria bacterium]|nr:hypothetical protein [Candidatus Spechtbacteria bacterium]